MEKICAIFVVRLMFDKCSRPFLKVYNRGPNPLEWGQIVIMVIGDTYKWSLNVDSNVRQYRIYSQFLVTVIIAFFFSLHRKIKTTFDVQ